MRVTWGLNTSSAFNWVFCTSVPVGARSELSLLISSQTFRESLNTILNFYHKLKFSNHYIFAILCRLPGRDIDLIKEKSTFN